MSRDLGRGVRQDLAPNSLEIAQVAQVSVPAIVVGRQLVGDSDRVIVSVQQLVDEPSQLATGRSSYVPGRDICCSELFRGSARSHALRFQPR